MEREFIKEDIKKAAVGTGIDRIIKDGEVFNLSGEDILRITDGKTNILQYEKLDSVVSLDEVLSPHRALVLLYQTAERFGHWVVLLDKGNKNLEFYDPYGLDVDEELNIDNEFHLRIHGGVITPHLSALIEKGGWRVTYNKERLQQMLEDVNTCGRYCALRVRFRDSSMEKFNGLLKDNKHYEPDMWVTALTLLC